MSSWHSSKDLKDVREEDLVGVWGKGSVIGGGDRAEALRQEATEVK